VNLKKNFIYPLVILLSVLLFFSNNVLAKKVYVTCDPPKGQRYDFEANDKEWKQIKDGFSGSHPTFFYDDSKPEELKTHWPAANPLGIDPKEIEKIVSGKATEKILTINDDLIESIQTGGTNTWITRLYPKKGIGVFLRHGYYLDETLYFGAVYKSNCNFKTLDNEASEDNSNNEDRDIPVKNFDEYSLIRTQVTKGERDGGFVCRLQNYMGIESENKLLAGIDFIFTLDGTGKNNPDNQLPRYIIGLSGTVGNYESPESFIIKSGVISLEINGGFFSFEKYDHELADKEFLDPNLYSHTYFLAFDKSLKANVVPFGQAMNILLQMSFGADVYLNFLAPDPYVEKRRVLEEEIEFYRFKLEFQEDKKEEVFACLSKAYAKGFTFLTDINSAN